MRPMTSRVSLNGGAIAGLHLPGKRGPLLLLHGNSSCKEVFIPVLAELCELEMAALAIDLPGHGDSADAPDPERTYTFPGYADVVFDVLDEMGWRQAGLLGWSLGGHVALECLARDREESRISSAFVISAPPGKPSQEAFEAAFATNATTLLAGKAEFNSTDAENYAAAMLGGSHYVTPELLQAVLRTDGRARARMLASALAGLGADQAETVATTSSRVALVIGGNDPFLRLDYLQRIPTANIWENRVHMSPDWGHAPHWQRDAEFKDILIRFYGHP